MDLANRQLIRVGDFASPFFRLAHTISKPYKIISYGRNIH